MANYPNQTVFGQFQTGEKKAVILYGDQIRLLFFALLIYLGNPFSNLDVHSTVLLERKNA